MVISTKYRFVFLHVPKAAGSSVAHALTQLDGCKHWAVSACTKHETLSQFYRRQKSARRPWYVVRRPSFADYSKLAFVRNPWDRIVSLYHYLESSGKRAEFADIRSFDHFVAGIQDKTPWIVGLHSLRPQCDFLVDESGQFDVDFVGHYESLEADFAKVARRIGFRAELPHKNRSDHEDYRCYYTPRTAAVIADHFARDAELFGYALDPPWPSRRFGARAGAA